MRIGITGASGFIGAAFARLAAASGHEVVAYSRRPNLRPGPAVTVLVQPGAAPHALPETRLDALVHLAGESLMGLWTPAKRARIRRSRVDLTRDLVAQVQTWRPENRPGILLAASGIGAYGSRGDETLDEASAPGRGFLAELCADWEAAARQAEAWGARVVHLRTGMVLGRNGGAWPLLRRLFKLGLGGRLGSGRQWTAWIHADDQAALMLWALENDAVRGPLNLCAPEPVTNAEFTRQIARHLHRPALLPAPAAALRLLLPGMAEEMLLCSQRAQPRQALALGYRFAHATLADALQALD